MLQDAVDYALSKGCIVIAAGGNDGIEQAIYPAAYPDVIGVSALGYNGQIWGGSNSGMHIDVSAPGVDILSTGLNNDYVYATGTSASTPMVSALASMLVSENPDLSSSFVERLMMQSVKDLGDKGRDNVYGSGEIDALAAVEQKVEPFHDVAVRNVSIEPLVFEKDKPTFIVADIENIGTYKEEETEIVLYEIIGEKKTEIGRKKSVVVINKANVTFEWKPEELKENVKFEVMVISDKDSNSSNNSKTTSVFTISESDEMYILHKVDPPVHQHIANEAFKLLIDGPMKTDLQPHLGSVGYYGNDAVGNDNYLLEGVSDEDIPRRWLNHGWDPDIGYNSSFPFGQSAIETAEDFLSQAKSLYEQGENKRGEAYWRLGRIAHLMGDMSVPAHTHLDLHADILLNDDEYEEWMQYTPLTNQDCTYNPDILIQCNFESYTIGLYSNISPTDYANLNMNASYMRNVYQNVYGNGSLPEFRTNLFKLMLDMAEIADEHESDGAAGEEGGSAHRNENVDCNIFGVCDVLPDELANHAYGLMKEAFQHVAGLYKLFWDTTHPALTNGVPNNDSVAQGTWKFYSFDVPSGATQLTVTTTNASGDVDLYVKFNQTPTSSVWDCRPFTSSGNETCTFSSPSAGTWLIGVNGFAAGTQTYTITATYTTTNPTVTWVSGWTPPSTMVSGQSYNVSWQITGASSLSHANVHWDLTDPTAITTCSNNLSCSTISPQGTATGGSANIMAPTVSFPTVLRYAVHFRDTSGGVNYYSNIVSVTVTPPEY
jgi:hypothetical protein